MTVPRLIAIVLIFGVAAMAWGVLGGSVQYRTDTSGAQLGERVEGLVGGPQTQTAPRFTYRPSAEKAAKPLAVSGSDITADFHLDQRRKGLLWYATYDVAFDATYRVTNPQASAASATMTFSFPTPNGDYDGFRVEADGREVPVTYADGQAPRAGRPRFTPAMRRRVWTSGATCPRPTGSVWWTTSRSR